MTTNLSLQERKCTPCSGNTPGLSAEQIKSYLKQVDGWKFVDNSIEKFFRFENYFDGLKFVNSVGLLAEEEGHHPDIFLGYEEVHISIKTHTINAVSKNDFILAAKIDNLII